MEPIEIDTHEAEEYPLATDDLSKGSVVPTEVIERAFRVQRDTKDFQLALLRASDFIARRFRDRGEVVFVTQERGSLRVLTDEEAVSYGAKLFRQGVRMAAHAHARQSAADRALMSEATRAEHDRSLEVQGRMLSAMRKERRAPVVEAAKRATPVLLRAVRAGDS